MKVNKYFLIIFLLAFFLGGCSFNIDQQQKSQLEKQGLKQETGTKQTGEEIDESGDMTLEEIEADLESLDDLESEEDLKDIEEEIEDELE